MTKETTSKKEANGGVPKRFSSIFRGRNTKMMIHKIITVRLFSLRFRSANVLSRSHYIQKRIVIIAIMFARNKCGTEI